MAKQTNAQEKAKNTLDTVSQKGRRGPKPKVDASAVRGRADNYRGFLQNVWDQLWPQLSQAQTEDDVIRAFREGYPGEHEFMPYRAPLVLKVLKERTFPKRRKAQINFLADSLAGLGLVSPRRSRDICAEDRARAKSAHHIIRYEFYVECSCGYTGPSRDHACPTCGAGITDLQHANHAIVISTLHAHLDHESCLEVVVLRGKSRDVQKLADRLISTKGVQHGRLVMSSPEIVSHHPPPHR